MKRRLTLRTILFLNIVFAVVIFAGCGDALTSDDASIVSIVPISGSRIEGPITITFDDRPTGVTLSSEQGGASWQLEGNLLTITDVVCHYKSPNSRFGKTEIYLKWDTGAQYLSYECRKPPPPATIVTLDPAEGSTIPSNTIIKITFDRSVDAVAGATGAGRLWEMAAAANLNVTWTNTDGTIGRRTFGYSLVAPDYTTPWITGGTVTDGAKNVDPRPINADKIKITFNENVAGTVKLNYEDNTSTGWQGRVRGKTAELTPVRGKELDFATTYVIVLKVVDAARNKAEYKIKFTTKARE